MALAWTATANPAFQDVNYASDTATFSTVAISAAAADRVVVVGVTQSEGVSITGVTIGGSAATEVISTTRAATDTIALYRRTVASGTTADIVVTCGGVIKSIGIQVGIITGANATPTATAILAFANQDDPLALSTNPTIPIGGLGLVVFGAMDGGLTYSWTNATQDYAGDQSGNKPTQSLAHSTTAGSWNPSADGQGWLDQGLVAAVWEPAAGGERKWILGRP